jgi:hypothetical protein
MSYFYARILHYLIFLTYGKTNLQRRISYIKRFERTKKYIRICCISKKIRFI